jgi:YVTN family beta-propeller protein
MFGAQQSGPAFGRRGRRGVALVVTLAVLTGSLGFAPGSGAGPTESGDSMVAGDGTVSPTAVPQCRAYVVNESSDNVSVIDTATDTVIDTFIAGNSPSGVAVSPDGATVYVTNGFDYTLSVIDTDTNVVSVNIDVRSPEGVAVSPDGTTVYVANLIEDTVSVIDTATDTVSTAIPVGQGPWGVDATPNGASVYVANRDDDTVSLINPATDTVTATILVGDRPFGLAVDPSSSLVYVANAGSDTVSVIATATNTVVGTIAVGRGPLGVAVAPDDSAVYVTNQSSGDVSVIAPSFFGVLATIPVGDGPSAVAFSPDGATAYVVNYGDDTVSVIDTATYTVVDTITVGSRPSDVAFGPCSAPGRPSVRGVAVTGPGSVRATVAGAPGGGAPTSFEVATLPDRRLCTVSGASGSCDISGLDERAVYRLAAVASNGGGLSPRSGASVSVTPGSGDAARAATQFGDVSAGVYYARGVDMLFQHGITTGKGSPNVFAPDEVVTRAQMATFLWRMAGEPPASACSFEDQSEIPTSARVAACWLQDNEYTTEDRYRPGDPVTRAQMAAFLFRIWGPSDGVYRESCGFSDEADIPVWALGATCWMKDNDITTGFGDTGGYAPRVTVTRGQMAAFLYRLGGYIEDRWRVIL